MVTSGKKHVSRSYASQQEEIQDTQNGNGHLKAFQAKAKRNNQLTSYTDIRSRERTAGVTSLVDFSRGEFQSRETGLTFYGIPRNDTNTDPSLRFIDPYTDQYKGRLINCFLFDPICNEAIRVRVAHLLGSATSINFYPSTGVIYDSDVAAKQALLSIINEQQQSQLREYIWKVEDKICHLRDHLYTSIIQSFAGGRSALYYETAKLKNDYGVPEGTPVAIKPLHFSYLGQVKVDPETWELDSVEYKDNIFQKLQTADDIARGTNYYVPANKMIYFVREDEHMTPNDYLYGKSILQSVLSSSETLRYIIEEDLPELNKSQWAGSGFFEFQGMANEEIQNLLDALEPGLKTAFNQPAKYTAIPAMGDATSLIKQLTELLQFMLIKLKVPTFLMNREDVTNRATTDTVSQIWQLTTLEQDRDWLRQILQRQWYDVLIYLETGIKPFDLKYEVRLEFESKLFTDILSKAQAITLMINAGVISRIEGREMLGLGPLETSIEGLSGLNPQDMQAVNDAMANINQQQTQQVQNANQNVSGFDLQTNNAVKKAQTLQGLRSATSMISKKAPPLATQVPQKGIV